MIPRVARSGQSFSGAGQYYLNDKLSKAANNAFEGIGDYALHDKQNRQTAHRVGFTAILNMEAQTPEEAIAQMTSSYQRYREREANKRGRKLTKPVYTYSLSWAPDQSPDREEMLAAAHSSIRALRLEGLQTLIVQHTDEPQPHIHVIVNRIERDGSRARNIPFDHLRFSAWAEAYEREHGGIRCEHRVANNERRREGVFVKDTVSLSRADYEAQEKERQRQPGRVVDRHKNAFRHHGEQINALWQKQAQERDTLLATTQTRIRQEATLLDQRFAPKWTALYIKQDQRRSELRWANRQGIFERACFLYRHRDLLKSSGRLRMRDIVRLCLSGKALSKRLEQSHQVERKEYGQWMRSQKQKAMAIAWTQHREDTVAMVMRHNLERDGLRYLQRIENELTKLAEIHASKDEQVLSDQRSLAAPTLSQGENFAPDELSSFVSDKSASVEFNIRSGESESDNASRKPNENKKGPNRGLDSDFGFEM